MLDLFIYLFTFLKIVQSSKITNSANVHKGLFYYLFIESVPKHKRYLKYSRVLSASRTGTASVKDNNQHPVTHLQSLCLHFNTKRINTVQ